MVPVADRLDLFDALVRDEKSALEIFRPTAYWRTYQERVAQAVRATGLAEVRRSQKILKGYATGGVARPTLPSSPLRRMVFEGLARLPLFRRIIAEYERLLRAQYMETIALRIELARAVLDDIAADFPELRIPAHLDAGGAEDMFDWQGMPVTAAFVPYLARAAGFYRVVDAGEVTSLLEIGPGIGFSSLAHWALNSRCRLFVNIDISTTAYVATQYLRAVDSFEIVDYLAVGEAETIHVTPSHARPRCYVLPPWILPRLSGEFDWFHNAYSFHEMEHDVVANYANHVKRLVRKGAWLLSSPSGHKSCAGGQTAPVRFSDIEAAFSSDFVFEATSSPARHGTDPACNRLYRRALM